MKAIRKHISEKRQKQEQEAAAFEEQQRKEDEQDEFESDQSDEDDVASKTSKSSAASQKRTIARPSSKVGNISTIDQIQRGPTYQQSHASQHPVNRLKTDDFSESGFSQLPVLDRTTRSTIRFDDTFTTHHHHHRRLSSYQELQDYEIQDPTLKAAYSGNLVELKRLMSLMNTEQINDDDVKTKNRLSFYLALLNQQVKTANYCLNQDENLKLVIIRVAQGQDQSNSSLNQTINQQNLNNQSQNLLNDSQAYLTPGGPNGREQSMRGFNETGNQLIDRVAQKMRQSFDPRQRSKIVDDDSISDPAVSSQREIDRLNQQSPDIRDRASVASSSFVIQGNATQHFDIYEHLNSEINFRTTQEMSRLKHVLQSACSVVFNTNMIKIALNMKEDRVAAVIIAQCPVIIDETTLNFAIQSQCFQFIHNIFLFEKTDVHVYNEASPHDSPSLIEGGNNSNQELQIKQFTVDELLSKCCDFFEKKECERICYVIMGWKIEPRGNILNLLCMRGLERVATHFMNSYPMLSDEEFFLECISEERQLFLKNALFDQFFDLDYMHNQRALRWIVDRLKTGNNILFALNLLLYANFRKWPHELLKDFTHAASVIISNQLERNILLISHNPIMALGLTIQFLHKLKNDFNEFDMECHKLVEKFQALGHLIIENMQFDHVEEIFMDRDFLDRTVLNVITENKIMPFIVINKLHFLINKIWDGKESDLIDGKTQHFSRTNYLLNHEIKRLRGVKVSFKDIMGTNFKPNIQDYNFTFQLKFRMQSVLIIFQKDFVCAFLIVLMFQYINYSYLNLFTERRYKHTDIYEERLAIIRTNLIEYKQYNFIGTILSISYFINFLCRVVYNQHTKKKIQMDLWLYFDLLAGVINIIAFNIVGGSSAENILNVQTKRAYDYYMILVLMISWFRFFSYFLVISHVSKITLTLFMMLRETVFFMVILSCYLMLMTTVFATLFRDTETNDAVHDYHSLFTTLRALVDYFLANFSVKDLGNYNLSHSILYIAHVTISNIFLLNFLVAILQTVFDIMIQNGDFYATQYQYIFITKYMKAMENDDGYDKLILFPPPLNFALVPLILVSPSRTLTKKAGRMITYTFFWLENVGLVVCFFAYMVAHDPFIIIKTQYQVITKIDGMFSKMYYSILWMVFGMVYLLYVNLYDTVMLVNILCLENSVIFVHGEEERTKNEAFTFYVNRNVIRAINQLKEIGDKSSVVFHKRQNVQRMQTQKMSLRDKIKNQQNEMTNEDIFIVRKELIIAVYEEISAHDPYVQRHRMQQILNNGGSGNTESNHRVSTSISHGTSAALNTSQANIQLMMKNAMQNTKQLAKNQYGEVDPQISPELRSIISKLMLSKNRDSIGELVEYMLKEKEKNYFQITEEEASEVDSFISKFTILQQNQETMTIDLDLVVKGFPKQINKQSIRRIQLLNFQRMQRILISFFNDDQDEMFNYYDNRMTRRLDILRDSTQRNSTHLDRILEVTKDVFNYIFFKEHLSKIHSIKRNNTYGLGDNMCLFSGTNQENQPRGSVLMQQISQMYSDSIPLKQQQTNSLQRQATMSKFMRQGTISSNKLQQQQFLSPNITFTPTQSKEQQLMQQIQISQQQHLQKLLNRGNGNQEDSVMSSIGGNLQAKETLAVAIKGAVESQRNLLQVNQKINQDIASQETNNRIRAASMKVPMKTSSGLNVAAQQTVVVIPPPQPIDEEKPSFKSRKEDETPDLGGLTDIDSILDLDFETKKIQQAVNLLRQKREILLKQQQQQQTLVSQNQHGAALMDVVDVDQTSQDNLSVDLSSSNQIDPSHRNQRMSNYSKQTNSMMIQQQQQQQKRQPRFSVLNTFIHQPTITNTAPMEMPNVYHNYMTSVGNKLQEGEHDDTSQQLEIEVPLTAEQILEHIRQQRKERSHEGGGSQFSNNDIQEFSAADFSSYYTAVAFKNRTITNANLAISPGSTLVFKSHAQQNHSLFPKDSKKSSARKRNQNSSDNNNSSSHNNQGIRQAPPKSLDSFRSDTETEQVNASINNGSSAKIGAGSRIKTINEDPNEND